MGAIMPAMCGHKLARDSRAFGGLVGPARLPSVLRLPFQSTLHQRGLVAVRAGNDGNDVEREPEAQSTDGTGNSNEPSRQAVNSKQQTQPSLARGQTTAIITGAISILFGIAYLALVQFMDMRGGELLPPPPEAYLP